MRVALTLTLLACCVAAAVGQAAELPAAAAVSAPATSAAAPSVWNINVRARVSTDPQYQDATASVFTVNGDTQALEYTMTTAQSITFKVNGADVGTHEFGVFNSQNPSGGNSLTGLLHTVATGSELTWTPPNDGTFYTACKVSGHRWMGTKITVTMAAIPATAVPASESNEAASSTGGGSGFPAKRPADQSICAYYAQKFGISQKQVVNDILDGALSGKVGDMTIGDTVPGIINAPRTKVFFDGSKQYRLASNAATWNLPSPLLDGYDKTPNFISDRPEGVQSWLVNHLKSFFGTTLGCNTPELTPYPSTTRQVDIHTNMNITQDVFTVFNNQVIGTLQYLNVNSEDVEIVRTVLNSFGRVGMGTTGSPFGKDVICQDPECECASGYQSKSIDPSCNTPVVNAAASASFSLLALAAAALAAIFAMRA